MIIVLTVLSGVTILSLVAAAFAFRNYRHVRQLQADVYGPLYKTVRRLSRSLSMFASGDLRVRTHVAEEAVQSPLSQSLSGLLASAVSDMNSVTDVPSSRICFSGANSYQEGKVAGQRIAAFLGGTGTVACIIPYYNQINHVLRMKGCFDYLAEQHKNIQLLGVYEGAGNREVTIEKVKELLDEHKKIDLIYITDGHTPPSVVETLVAQDRGTTRVVAFDAMKENVELLKQGRIVCLVEQNSFAQAHNALVHLYNTLEAGWQPLTAKLFMKPIAIDKDNYRTYWDDEKETRIMMEDEQAQLAEPEPNRSGRHYRLGLIIPLSIGFFEGLGRGAEAAKKKLAGYGVDVEIVDAFDDWANFGQASVFNPVIDRFVEAGYDGFSTVVVDPAIVSTINRVVSSGMRVTTFNTEPSSFREIIQTMIENIKRLADSSQTLAAAAEESSRATTQIGGAISGIKQDITEEKKRVEASDRELNSLNSMIEEMQHSLSEYGRLVDQLNGETDRGSQLVEQMFGETKSLRDLMTRIENELQAFSERLKRVQEFAGVIEQLAENTNVLAINASIQAARAGTAGKAFAVVAGEVRTLAENSGHTAEDIHRIVDEITGSMSGILAESTTGATHVAETYQRAQNTRQAFESISSVVEEANAAIGKIEQAVEGILATGRVVKENMDVIDRMSDTSVSRLDEISVSISELSVQGSHLSTTANELREMAANQEVVFDQLSVRD